MAKVASLLFTVSKRIDHRLPRVFSTQAMNIHMVSMWISAWSMVAVETADNTVLCHSRDIDPDMALGTSMTQTSTWLQAVAVQTMDICMALHSNMGHCTSTQTLAAVVPRAKTWPSVAAWTQTSLWPHLPA